MKFSLGSWRHGDFLKFWTGETVSLFGSGISSFALPLVGVLALHAGAKQMGGFSAVQAVPMIVLGLVAGAWIDRLPRRKVLITYDLACVVLLAVIPLGAAMGFLSFPMLYAVLAAAGLVSVLGAAFNAYWPTLLPDEDVADGNQRLDVSERTAAVVSPGIGGLLVQALGAPVTLLADLATYLVSALCLWRIRTPETPRPLPEGGQTIRRDILEGLSATFADPLQRAISLSWGVRALLGAVMAPLYELYALRHLHITVALLGAVGIVGSLGGIGSVLLARSINRRLGMPRATIVSTLAWALGPLLLFVAHPGQSVLAVFALLAGAALLRSSTGAFFIFNLSTVRQLSVPGQLLGRVWASQRELFSVVTLLGALVGGFAGATIGLRWVFLGVACAAPTVAVGLLLSPFRHLNELRAKAKAL